MTLSWYLINITCSQDPKETPPPTRGETRDEKTERKVHIKYLYENIFHVLQRNVEQELIHLKNG